MTKITQTIYLLIIMIIPNITQANIEILEYETKNGIKFFIRNQKTFL